MIPQLPSTNSQEQPEEQADKHFRHGIRRAVLRRLAKRISAWTRRCCSVAGRQALGLAECFSEELSGRFSRERVSVGTGGGYRGDKGQRSRVWLGPQEVEISRIVGSVGRCEEFDEDFRPLKRSLRSRWKGVYGALAGGRVLPAVKLFKVGERYFVEDGNHRVSVARYRGAQIIDAEVTEVTGVTEAPEVPGVSLHGSSTAAADTHARGDSDAGEQDIPKARG